MASILSLPDDCLYRIVSFINDPGSFYSLALTCKRFLQVTSNTRSVLHTNLLQAKAEYFIRCFVVENRVDYEIIWRLEEFLLESARLTEAKSLLTYDKVIDSWQRNGPVVAKLFTWLRNIESSIEEGHPRATSFTKLRKVDLSLPSCGKTMVVETSYFDDYGHNYEPELSIHVTCGDIDVKSEGFASSSPEDYLYWEEGEVSCAVQPMKAIIELLQKELGETVPPITSHFFIWLCYFFPDKSNLDEAHRPSFKDANRNLKPTDAVVQLAIEEYQKNQQIETKLQSLMSGWKNDEDQNSKYWKVISETATVLAQRSETIIIKCLNEDTSRFRRVAADYDMRKLPKQLLLDLILRTTLGESGYRPGPIANKFVEGTVFFRCFGGKVMRLHGSMHGDGAGYPSWDEMKLEFTLPDGNILMLRGKNYNPLNIEDLTPVTELLQQGVTLRVQEEKKTQIPKIGNLFTAAFFIKALDFSMASDTFLGRYDKLIPSDSEEELSSAEELSEESEP